MNDEEFQINERSLGPARSIEYVEGEKHLSFFGEPITDGFAIRVPTGTEWKIFCERQGGEWAIYRREVLIKNIIEGMRTRYHSNEVTLDDNYWITVRFRSILDFRGVLTKLRRLRRFLSK